MPASGMLGGTCGGQGEVLEVLAPDGHPPIWNHEQGFNSGHFWRNPEVAPVTCLADPAADPGPLEARLENPRDWMGGKSARGQRN